MLHSGAPEGKKARPFDFPFVTVNCWPCAVFVFGVVEFDRAGLIELMNVTFW